MKRMISRKRISILFFFLILNAGLCVTGFSQPGDPGGDDDAPITGIEWLLLGGGLFGARKIYSCYKKEK